MACSQKFQRGDHVHIAKDLGAEMRHFEADREAIVIGSYDDQYGGGNTGEYKLHVKGCGEISWYKEHQLTLISARRSDLLDQWESERDREIAIKSDLGWIFANGPETVKAPHGASLQALADCVGVNLWGNRGEGIVWYQNAMTILEIAKPFLLAGDKDGWLAFIAKNKTP